MLKDRHRATLKNLTLSSGVLISPQTLAAVKSFVRKGGLCVSLDSLAPPEFAGRSGKISDGSGLPHKLMVEILGQLVMIKQPSYHFNDLILRIIYHSNKLFAVGA